MSLSIRWNHILALVKCVNGRTKDHITVQEHKGHSVQVAIVENCIQYMLYHPDGGYSYYDSWEETMSYLENV